MREPTRDLLRIFAHRLQTAGDRDPIPVRDLLALFEHDIAEAGRAFAAGPVVQFVKERPRLRGGPGRGDGAHDAAPLDDVLERVERHVLARKLRRHVGDHKRIA